MTDKDQERLAYYREVVTWVDWTPRDYHIEELLDIAARLTAELNAALDTLDTWDDVHQ